MGSSIEKVKEEITGTWMEIDGVNGVALGEIDGKACILVTADAMTPEVKANIPSEYNGFAVKVLVTGSIIAQKNHKDTRARANGKSTHPSRGI